MMSSHRFHARKGFLIALRTALKQFNKYMGWSLTNQALGEDDGKQKILKERYKH